MRKLILLSLLAVASALGLVILLRRNVGTPLAVFNIFADAALGVVVGMGTRMVFRHKHWLMRAVLAAGFSLLGLVVLGLLTLGGSGIGPLHIERVPVDVAGASPVVIPVPSPLGAGQQLLADLAHLVLAVSISWIAMRAWNGGYRVSVAPASGRPSAEAHVSPPAKPLPIAVTAQRLRPLSPVRRSRIPSARLKKASSASILVRTPHPGAVRPVRRWRGFLRRKPGVRLATYEEHRCPYCLEPVRRNDPRGTVECPICHTLHHKDCWDVTGTCQVPHLTA